MPNGSLPWSEEGSSTDPCIGRCRIPASYPNDSRGDCSNCSAAVAQIRQHQGTARATVAPSALYGHVDPANLAKHRYHIQVEVPWCCPASILDVEWKVVICIDHQTFRAKTTRLEPRFVQHFLIWSTSLWCVGGVVSCISAKI